MNLPLDGSPCGAGDSHDEGMNDMPEKSTPSLSDPAVPGASDEQLAAALQHAAPRLRSVDDHMFRVGQTSFRLQLFTTRGQRAVAVATQAEDEVPSLTNVAELCAAAVWRQHCPDQEMPPLWIQRHLLGAFGEEPEFELVTFGESEPHQVHSPSWCTISAEQLTYLVGGPVAEDRGEGYVEPEPALEPELRFETIALWRIAQPQPFREACLSAGAPWWRRWTNQIFPSGEKRSCCWYHSGDWHRVQAVARDALARARRANVSAEDMRDYVLQYATEAEASSWEREVLVSLFSLSDSIQVSRRGWFGKSFTNGQHRVQAMLDAGVRRTVVLRDV